MRARQRTCAKISTHSRAQNERAATARAELASRDESSVSTEIVFRVGVQIVRGTASSSHVQASNHCTLSIVIFCSIFCSWRLRWRSERHGCGRFRSTKQRAERHRCVGRSLVDDVGAARARVRIRAQPSFLSSFSFFSSSSSVFFILDFVSHIATLLLLIIIVSNIQPAVDSLA